MNKQKVCKIIAEIVGENNVFVDESMAKHTTFKVGGNADIFVNVYNHSQIQDILNANIEEPITIIGNGSNILVKDNGIRGIVINYNANSYKIDGNIAYVDAGVKNGVLAIALANKELAGFEFASGIPGTIGGAIFMNAGAYGMQISDVVESVTYIDMDTNMINTIQNNECEFLYRKSVFMKINTVIISAKLKLNYDKKEEILKRMEEYREKRINSQPLDMPNAGSTFKRKDNLVPAKLIDEAGLKGYKVGGAEVSKKHAGFIVNAGGATAEDVLKLVEIIRKKVYEKFNKKIELEMRVIGE